MSQQTTFLAPPAPPPAAIVQNEIDAAAKADLAETFDAFWARYPKRPNNPKELARRSWKKALRNTPVEAIMAGLARYEFSPEPKYRPMAATWLNQRRWEVENDDLTTDAYGLAEWLAALPRDGGMSAVCYDVSELRPILVATGWSPDWRGPLDILNGWMRDAYIPDSCARVIAAAVAEFGVRASLAAFDKRVRYRAERITGMGGL